MSEDNEKKDINIEGDVIGEHINIGGDQRIYSLGKDREHAQNPNAYVNIGGQQRIFFVQGDMVYTAGERKIPFIAPDLPPTFVNRPDQYGALLSQLIAEDSKQTVGITSALQGAGGFGKTTLATALCHDKRVQEHYPDGILWITLGEQGQVLQGLMKLYGELTGARPAFVDIEDASSELAEELKDRRCLMVIDDVWDIAHLRPFLRGGEHCTRLITTRHADIVTETHAKNIQVDEMKSDEAVNLLLAGIDEQPDELKPFAALAGRLGEWALLVEIANAMLREEISGGADLMTAMRWVNEVLTEEGVKGVERENEEERKRSATSVLAASFRRLEANDLTHLAELAIFREDTDVYLPSVVVLWDLGKVKTKKLIDRFARLSFIKFDTEKLVFRMHDVIHEVLLSRLDNVRAVHERLIANYGDLTNLPDEYAWRAIAYHLSCAAQSTKLMDLLLTYTYLWHKLNATDINALIDDCDVILDKIQPELIRLLRSTFAMSAHVLVQDRSALPHQLAGRLMLYRDEPTIRRLTEVIQPPMLASVWLDTDQHTHDPAGGEIIRRIVGHTDEVKSVAWSWDGNHIVTGSFDNRVTVWHSATGLEKWSIQTQGRIAGRVYAVAWSPDNKTVVSASGSGILTIWDAQTGSKIRDLIGHRDGANSVAFTPDGNRIASSSDDRSAIIWDLKTEKHLRLLGHTTSVRCVAWSPDATRLATASPDKTIIVWDGNTGQMIHKLAGHTGRVRSVAWSPDGYHIVSASEDTTLIIWDVTNEKPVRTMKGHTDDVTCVTWSASGELIASASLDKTIVIWELDDDTEQRQLVGHSKGIWSVCFSPGSNRLASASMDNTSIIWEIAGSSRIAKRQQIHHGHTDIVNSISWSPDSKFIVSASNDTTLLVWDIQNGSVVKRLNRHNNSVRSVAWSPDGKYIASTSNETYSLIWDVETEKVVNFVEVPKKKKTHNTTDDKNVTNVVAWSPDSSIVALPYVQNGFLIYNLITKETEFLRDRHTSFGTNSFAWSPDGQKILSSGNDHELCMTDADRKSNFIKRTWKTREKGNLKIHLWGMHGAVWSSDGHRFMTISGTNWDKKDVITFWTRDAVEVQHQLHMEPAWINCVVWIASDTRIVAATQDRRLVVFDSETGRHVHTFYCDAPIKCCVLAPNGKFLAAGDEIGRISVLNWVE